MKHLFMAFSLALALVTGAAPVMAGPSLKVAAPMVAAGKKITIPVEITGDTGKPVSGKIVVTSLRVDMGPDNMKAMTTPATASVMPGMVMVHTNLYAPGHWAIIISGTADGKPFTGSVTVMAMQKQAAAAPHPMKIAEGGSNAAPGHKASPPKATGPKATGKRKILYYRNPMGLPDTSPVPKKDSMGMDYIPVYADELKLKPGTVRLTTAKMQRTGVRLTPVREMQLSRTIHASARTAADESRQSVLTARFSGFIDKLYVNRTGEKVRKGQPMMRVWISDSDVLNREADYIGAMASGQEKRAAVSKAMLLQYGVPEFEIRKMAKTGVPTRTITILAPHSGTVMEKDAVTGMSFSAGTTLFKTTDLTTLWLLADITEHDLPYVHAGDVAHVTFQDNPNADFSGKVTMVYPELDSDTRVVSARIVLDNAKDALRVGQYGFARIEAPVARHPVLAIPASAVIDDGTKPKAFVALPDGLFEPRTLTLGYRSAAMVEVRSGLKAGEKVVTDGTFLIDADSNLNSALQNFMPADNATQNKGAKE